MGKVGAAVAEVALMLASRAMELKQHLAVVSAGKLVEVA